MTQTVKRIYTTVRRPSGDDSGQVECGFYIFEKGVVTLTDESGTPLRRGLDQRLSTRKLKGEKEIPTWSAPVPSGLAEQQIAGRLLHGKFSSERSESDFNRPLIYPRHSIA